MTHPYRKTPDDTASSRKAIAEDVERRRAEAEKPAPPPAPKGPTMADLFKQFETGSKQVKL